MVNHNTSTKSLLKVYDFLKEEDKKLTPTELGISLGLNYNCVKKCIEVLDYLEKVNVISNGKTMMVELRIKDKKNEWT